MTVIIEKLTHQGLGRVAGLDIFLPRVLPGEAVEIAGDGTPRIVTPAPDRVRPPCRHFKACGGCALQHASDDFVAQFKTDVVRNALAARGLNPEIKPIATSPAQSRRRAKLTGKRTKNGAMVGFHARASHVLIDVPDCQLLHPNLMAGLPMLERLTTLAASRKGTIDLTVTDSSAGLDVLIGSASPPSDAQRIALGQWAGTEKIARLTWNDEVLAMRHPPAQTFGTARVVPPPGSFLQATRHGEATLQAAVAEGVAGSRRICDLFSGCGTFALPLAEQAEIAAVEGEAEMLAALEKGWRETPDLHRVVTQTRDLFRRPLEPDELARFDAVVIDPPRAGAAAQVERLADSPVPRIAMVSCNPVTFARDAATLVARGFDLKWVLPVDQFRWSAHVEIVAAFEKN